MVSRITSGAVHGIESFLVQVEVDVSNGLPGLELVGLLSSEVREAKERVRVALKNTGVNLPPTRITVSLSPADLRKQGSAFDLPIAAGILESLGVFGPERFQESIVAGELGLDGRVRPVRGILPMVLEAKRRGKKCCVIPKENAKEALLVEQMRVVAVNDLKEFIGFAKGERKEEAPLAGEDDRTEENEGERNNLPDFRELGGALRIRRAAEIAAAGFHHMLMLGPPGSGKTLAARCMPGILPELSGEEILEVSAIYSVAGLWGRESGKRMESRPFVSPHHTVTPQALAGGGAVPRPGAVSLAHHGVLFLDEMTEFKRSTLDLLRQPLEEKRICITRNHGNYIYPADFMLVAAANPCPCGYYPDRRRCRCSEAEVKRYLGRISGPVLDRIDLCVETKRVEFSDLEGTKQGEDSRHMRERVLDARRVQEERFRGRKIRYNAQMSPGELGEFCALGSEERRFMERIFEPFGLSARGYHRMLKTARTIADLEQSADIRTVHLSEALSFRADLNREERADG